MLLAEGAVVGRCVRRSSSSIQRGISAYHGLKGRHPAVSTGGGWDEVSIVVQPTLKLGNSKSRVCLAESENVRAPKKPN